MTASRVLAEDDLAGDRPSPRASTLSRWLEALNAFLERSFRTADIDTGC
ncbi:MAG: hypothetical protein ACM3JH_11675 [Acidithiobacillales bacterium]